MKIHLCIKQKQKQNNIERTIEFYLFALISKTNAIIRYLPINVPSCDDAHQPKQFIVLLLFLFFFSLFHFAIERCSINSLQENFLLSLSTIFIIIYFDLFISKKKNKKNSNIPEEHRKYLGHLMFGLAETKEDRRR